VDRDPVLHGKLNGHLCLAATGDKGRKKMRKMTILPVRMGVACALAVAVITVSQSSDAQTATSVIVTNPVGNPVHTKATDNPALQPFQANITITIQNGNSGGTDNGNVSPGTQTVLIPAKKRLVVQTVSVYRAGAISASTVQIFVNASVQGTYASYALPLTPASAATYVGTTFNGVFYADADTELLANAFRNSTSGAETDTVSVTGYLVNVP
jgi:hypothetical protein